jgi:periplasmic divalent cation tolerance protein
MTEFIQVLTAISSKEDAQKVATAIVGEHLAACVQIIGPITSTYWWQGAMETAEEWLCLMKTRQGRYERLEQAIRAVHPYDEPEILATPVSAGSRTYLDWIVSETSPA